MCEFLSALKLVEILTFHCQGLFCSAPRCMPRMMISKSRDWTCPFSGAQTWDCLYVYFYIQCAHLPTFRCVFLFYVCVCVCVVCALHSPCIPRIMSSRSNRPDWTCPFCGSQTPGTIHTCIFIRCKLFCSYIFIYSECMCLCLCKGLPGMMISKKQVDQIGVVLLVGRRKPEHRRTADVDCFNGRKIFARGLQSPYTELSAHQTRI